MYRFNLISLGRHLKCYNFKNTGILLKTYKKGPYFLTRYEEEDKISSLQKTVEDLQNLLEDIKTLTQNSAGIQAGGAGKTGKCG